LHEFDNHCRHRGSDEGDAPLLVELEGAPAEGDVVIGGKKSDQAEGEATDGLRQPQAIEPEAIQARPSAGCGW
jgi:hypothetical protein